LAERIITPYQYQFGVLVSAISTLLDYAALLGVVLAVALAIRMAWHRQFGPVECSVYVFVVFAAFIDSPGAWTEVYAFGRTLTPLVLLLALYGLPKRNWIALLPLALIVPRTAIQFAPQAAGVLRGLL
jgi:hypothetical protein